MSEIRKVKIVSNGYSAGTSVVDSMTGENIPECFAFEVSGSRMSAATKATVFCYLAETDIETDAEIVRVPTAFRDRAMKAYRETNSDEVKMVLRNLFGISECSYAEYGSRFAKGVVPKTE